MKFHAAIALILGVLSVACCEGQDQKSLRNLTEPQYQNSFSRWVNEGYRPVTADVRVAGNQARFSIQFRKPAKGEAVPAFAAKHHLTDERYAEVAREMQSRGWKETLHQSYRLDNTRLHLAFWFAPLNPILDGIWKSPDKVHQSGQTDANWTMLDRTMADFLAVHQMPGVTVAVGYDGQLIYERGFGYSDWPRRTQMKPDDRMRIASISKPITAAAVLQLAGQGQLELDAPISRYLKTKPRQGRKDNPQFMGITLRQLLHHTGGFDRGASYDPMFQPQRMSQGLQQPLPLSTTDVIRFMQSEPLDFEPGSKKVYSNFGYCLLGRAIESATGQTYETYVQNQVLRPLKIQRMEIGKTAESARAENEVRYSLRKPRTAAAVDGQVGANVPSQYGGFNVPVMDAHGGWIASAGDLVRFAMAFDEPDACPLMSGERVREMFARPDYLKIEPKNGVERYYSCGWSIVKTRQGMNAYHTGSLPGTSTILVRRRDGYCWAVLFNCRDTLEGKTASGLIDPMMHRCVDDYLRRR